MVGVACTVGDGVGVFVDATPVGVFVGVLVGTSVPVGVAVAVLVDVPVAPGCVFVAVAVLVAVDVSVACPVDDGVAVCVPVWVAVDVWVLVAVAVVLPGGQYIMPLASRLSSPAMTGWFWVDPLLLSAAATWITARLVSLTHEELGVSAA